MTWHFYSKRSAFNEKNSLYKLQLYVAAKEKVDRGNARLVVPDVPLKNQMTKIIEDFAILFLSRFLLHRISQVQDKQYISVPKSQENHFAVVME